MGRPTVYAVLSAVAAVMAGCGPSRSELVLQHHRQCLDYGFELASTGYAYCRLTLDQGQSNPRTLLLLPPERRVPRRDGDIPRRDGDIPRRDGDAACEDGDAACEGPSARGLTTAHRDGD